MEVCRRPGPGGRRARMINATTRFAATAAILSLGLMTCRASRSRDPMPSPVTASGDGAAGDATNVSARAPDLGSDEPRAAVPECVLDVGESRKGSRTRVGRDGVLTIVHPQPRCSLEASCIREQGRDHPGDATISIDCRGNHCACTFQSLSPRPNTIKFSFDAEDPCDDARLKSLLLDRCLSEGRRRSTPGRRH